MSLQRYVQIKPLFNGRVYWRRGNPDRRIRSGLPIKASKRPLVRRTYHERVLDDHHVCSILRTVVQVSFCGLCAG